MHFIHYLFIETLQVNKQYKHNQIKSKLNDRAKFQINKKNTHFPFDFKRIVAYILFGQDLRTSKWKQKSLQFMMKKCPAQRT